MNTIKSRIACLAAVAALAVPATAWASDGPISVNVRAADLTDVIALIAQEAGINIVIDGDVAAIASQQKVTMRLSHVSLRTALHSIEASNGLSDAYEDNILHIGLASNIVHAFPNANGVSAVIVPIKYANVAEVYSTIQATLPPGAIVVPDNRTNTLFVKGDVNAISMVRGLVASIDVPRSSSEAFKSVELHLSHVKASDAVNIMQKQLPANINSSYAANDANNSIVAQGNPDFIERASSLVTAIDMPGQQVRFDVRVLDVTPTNDNSNIGVTFGGSNISGTQSAGSGSTASVFARRSLPLNATINFLQQKGEGKILAEPELTTLNNQKATLNIGQQYPITYFNPQVGQTQVQFINAGVNLAITPIIGTDGTITCQLDTQYSAILTFINGYPEIGDRHAVTTLRVPNDQSIVIAGLFQDITNETVQKVPILGSIPIFGEIFKNRQKSHTRDEIIFVVTPHIITDADFKSSESEAISTSKILAPGIDKSYDSKIKMKR